MSTSRVLFVLCICALASCIAARTVEREQPLRRQVLQDGDMGDMGDMGDLFGGLNLDKLGDLAGGLDIPDDAQEQLDNLFNGDLNGDGKPGDFEGIFAGLTDVLGSPEGMAALEECSQDLEALAPKAEACAAITPENPECPQDCKDYLNAFVDSACKEYVQQLYASLAKEDIATYDNYCDTNIEDLFGGGAIPEAVTPSPEDVTASPPMVVASPPVVVAPSPPVEVVSPPPAAVSPTPVVVTASPPPASSAVKAALSLVAVGVVAAMF